MKRGLIVLVLLLLFLFGCVKVQEENPSGVKAVCVNAQNDGLCNGLNFVFGEGYEGECCESFGKCCG